MSILSDDPFFIKPAKKQIEKHETHLSRNSFTKQLQDKLSGGKFRYINEQLYTVTGDAAKKSFEKDPSLFETVYSLNLYFCFYFFLSIDII